MQSTFLDGDRCLVEIDPPYNPLPVSKPFFETLLKETGAHKCVATCRIHSFKILLFPLQSYWLSLLYKILIGQDVFAATTTDTTGKLRAYAHCVNSQRYAPSHKYIVNININKINKQIYLDK